MARQTEIAWADSTFNPWVGCTKVSPACDHCYAESWAKRSGSVQWGGERRRTTVANWRLPLKWNAQAEREGRRFRVFCASLADVFDNEVPDAWRADLFWLIKHTPRLDWLLLTKRIGNAQQMIADALTTIDPAGEWPMPWSNVRIGATIANQTEYDRDIGKVLRLGCPTFLSIEPMLGPINLRLGGASMPDYAPHRPLGRIDWVICGGESGPGARPMHPDWARSLRDQCAAAGVPFLFKQWGEWLAESDGADMLGTERSPMYQIPTGGLMVKVGKKAAGRLLDGVTHDGFPEPTGAPA